MLQIRAADTVSHIIDLRRLADLFGHHIIEIMTQELNRRPCAKVRATNPDHKKNFGIPLDLLRRFFDACEFFFIIINRKIDPSKEIISRAFSSEKFCFGVLRDLLHRYDLVF